jgi:hypothetical protein
MKHNTSHMGVASLWLLLAAFLVSTTTVSSTVVLPEYNRSFTSMPALFGGQLNYNDPPVMAHLTLVRDNPLLCSENSDLEIPNSNSNNNTNTRTIIETPDDGLPVAVLVERGKCTFYEKAQEASKLGEAVRYIVVYDNEVSPDLVPMSSEHSTNMTLLFVSNLSGEGASCNHGDVRMMMLLLLMKSLTHMLLFSLSLHRNQRFGHEENDQWRAKRSRIVRDTRRIGWEIALSRTAHAGTEYGSLLSGRHVGVSRLFDFLWVYSDLCPAGIHHGTARRTRKDRAVCGRTGSSQRGRSSGA